MGLDEDGCEVDAIEPCKMAKILGFSKQREQQIYRSATDSINVAIKDFMIKGGLVV